MDVRVEGGVRGVLPNWVLAADVALAALGTTQQNATRSADTATSFWHDSRATRLPLGMSEARDVNLPTTVLLPGLDGTGELFAPFLAMAPSNCRVQSMKLPPDRGLSYSELAEWVDARLPDGPLVLLAESFSGPLAILVASRCVRVAGLVLSTTFLERPLPGVLAFVSRLVPRRAWMQPPPEVFLRIFLTGGDSALAAAVRRALLGVSGEVTAQRITSVLTVDVTSEFRTLTCPVLCLQARRDRLVSARSVARMRAIRPNSEFAEIDAPHLLLQTCPQEAWTYVSAFLARCSVSP
jgi:pimeloyl-[acyl-carrier protein] methyl ester esterase